VKHPINTADFSSFLLQAQSAKPDVIVLANVGADTVTSLKRAAEFGLTSGPNAIKRAGLLAMINDIEALGLEFAHHVLVSESFYWDMNDATRAWAKRFRERTGAAPNMLQAAVYSSVLHYLKAVEKVGKTDGIPVAMAMSGSQPPRQSVENRDQPIGFEFAADVEWGFDRGERMPPDWKPSAA
jgi:branched-chain amino acid transport system substrate-binding protein